MLYPLLYNLELFPLSLEISGNRYKLSLRNLINV